MRTILRFVVFLLVLQGILELWEFAEIALYGISQESIVDTIAAYFIANQIDDWIFGKGGNK